MTDDNYVSPGVTDPADPSRLSEIGQMYDINGDGVLDETERAMRKLDKSGRGFLTNDKVYDLMQKQLEMQRSMFQMKKIITGLLAFVFILALANLGTSFASAILAKDTKMTNGELVDIKTNEAVATADAVETFTVEANDGENAARKLQCATTDIDTDASDCDIATISATTMSLTNGQAMLTDCQQNRNVELHYTGSSGGVTQKMICGPSLCTGSTFFRQNNGPPTSGNLCIPGSSQLIQVRKIGNAYKLSVNIFAVQNVNAGGGVYPITSQGYSGPIANGENSFKFDPQVQAQARPILTNASDVLEVQPPASTFDYLCPMADTYVTAAGDSGDEIALKFYPDDDAMETWARIVSCNAALRELYDTLHPDDRMTVHFETVENMKLIIPSKEAISEIIVVENTTYGELAENYTMIIDVDQVNSGGRRLMTEGSITSLGPYPGTSDKSWNRWQCIPMYNRDGRATVTIITHGNANCQAMLTRANDGCSSPVWSAYTWAFTPACQRHDICYWFSKHYDPTNRPQTVNSRELCDHRFRADMESACDWHHCDAWWKGIECGFCKATASVWSDAVWNAQRGKTTTPISGFNNDGSTSSLKQIWRPWDWRMPADIKYARSFLESSGRIASMMNGKVITVVPNTVSYLTMGDPNNGYNRFVRRNSFDSTQIFAGYYHCLDVYAFGGPGTRVVTWACNDADNQKWIYDDIQRLHPAHRPDLCLDIWQASDATGAYLVVWWCHGGSNQQWFTY